MADKVGGAVTVAKVAKQLIWPSHPLSSTCKCWTTQTNDFIISNHCKLDNEWHLKPVATANVPKGISSPCIYTVILLQYERTLLKLWINCCNYELIVTKWINWCNGWNPNCLKSNTRWNLNTAGGQSWKTSCLKKKIPATSFYVATLDLFEFQIETQKPQNFCWKQPK